VREAIMLPRKQVLNFRAWFDEAWNPIRNLAEKINPLPLPKKPDRYVELHMAGFFAHPGEVNLPGGSPRIFMDI
jgi:hypothetical protein